MPLTNGPVCALEEPWSGRLEYTSTVLPPLLLLELEPLELLLLLLLLLLELPQAPSPSAAPASRHAATAGRKIRIRLLWG
jgi:hypothetical protein